MLYKFLIILIFTLVSCQKVDLQTNKKFHQAVKLYDEENYQKASQIFREISLESPSSDAFFNLGNSYFRLDKRGHAMAAYLAASNLSPRDPDIIANMNYLKNNITDNLDVSSQSVFESIFFFWRSFITPLELAYVSAFLWALGFLFLTLYLWKKNFHQLLSLSFCLIFCSVFTFFASYTSQTYDKRWGAVTANISKIKSGPGEHNTLVFELHEGAPFLLEVEEGEWYKIQLSDGKKGWVEKSSVLVF